MLGGVTYLPLFALVAVFAGVWGWASLADRRFRDAVTAAAARLGGRYEKGGATTGGSLFVKVGARDVVLCFTRSSSRNPEYTSAVAILRRDVKEPLLLKGADAVARAPGLAAYSRWHCRPVLQLQSNLLTARVHGLIRNADRLVALAELVAGLADELDA